MTTPPILGSSVLCILDSQHLVLLIGSNSTPINVQSVNVWQASAANNITN